MAMQMEKGQWNPYVAGTLSRLVIIGSVWLNGKYAGASTTFVRSAGMIGYCPGTSMGALGEGRGDAAWGIIGMLVGAALFAESYPTLKATVLTWGDFGKITIPQLFGINHWPVIAFFVAAGALLLRWFEKKGL